MGDCPTRCSINSLGKLWCRRDRNYLRDLHARGDSRPRLVSHRHAFRTRLAGGARPGCRHIQRLPPRHPIRELESSKWRLWHGRSSACLGRLARLSHWFDAAHVRDIRGADAARRHINDLIEYLYANRLALVNYGRRRHEQRPISTAFVESAVNEILSKRMIKKQPMRWNRWTVQPFLDVRVAVLNKTLAGSFMRLYPDFRSANENYPIRLSVWGTP